MTISQDTLNKFQSIAAIGSSVAIPIVIAVVGWVVQTTISEESIKKDYVQMAAQILKDSEKQKDDDLRKWAVAVLDKNSPVPFSSGLKDKLEKGTLIVKSPFPMPPDVLMSPPVKLQKLPEGKPLLMSDVLRNTVENYRRCGENALTLEYLQKWIIEMKAIDDKYSTPTGKP